MANRGANSWRLTMAQIRALRPEWPEQLVQDYFNRQVDIERLENSPGGGGPGTPPWSKPDGEPYFLIFTGQSNNLANDGAIIANTPMVRNENVFSWQPDGVGGFVWESVDPLAAEPPEWAGQVPKIGMRLASHGNIGWTAADQIQKLTGNPVYMLTTGFGGLGIDAWQPGNVMNNTLTTQVAACLATSELAALTVADSWIWMQGEADGTLSPVEYAALWQTMIDDAVSKGWVADRFTRFSICDLSPVNANAPRTPAAFQHIDNTYDEYYRVVQSFGLDALPDTVHFTGDSLNYLGVPVSLQVILGPQVKSLLNKMDALGDVNLSDLDDGDGLYYLDGEWVNHTPFQESWPTGLANGGELNIGPGVNDIEVIAGLGAILNNYDNPLSPPVLIGVRWDQINEPITAAPAVAGSVVWFSIFDTGVADTPQGSVPINVGALRQYSVPPDPSLARQEVFLGAAVHNGVEWKEISNPKVINQAAETLREYLVNVTGPSHVIQGGAVSELPTFELDQAAGVIWENNRNWHVDKSNPNREALPAQSPLTFQYVNGDFTDVGASTTVVDPSLYTPFPGTGVPVGVGGGANTATIQRLYIDPANNYWMLWGQYEYPSFAVANANLLSDNPTVPFILQNSILLGYVVSEKGKTDWDVNEAIFVPAGGSGGSGAAGVPVTEFINLSDTPVSYAGNKFTVPQVNEAETALEFDYRTEAVPYITGDTYFPQQMVYVNGYLSVANTETDDFPVPTTVGSPINIYNGTSPSAAVTAKQVVFGNRYTLTGVSGQVSALRVWVVLGNFYRLFVVDDPLGAKIPREITTFTAVQNGWFDISINPELVIDGATFDVVAIVQEPDPTPTTFSGNWNYTTPNNTSVPGSGVVVHSDKEKNEFRINVTDNDGGDRTVELAALDVGDVIDWGNGGTRWAIQSIVDNTTWFNLFVAPATQEAPDGVHNFTFETVTATPITRMADLNWWLLNPPVNGSAAGLYIEDDSYLNIVPDDSAYGTDIVVQQLTQSPDWDIFGIPGSGGGGGGSEPEDPRLDGEVVEVLIDEITDPWNEIFFFEVPSGYRELRLAVRARSTRNASADGMRLFFNLDETDANYFYQQSMAQNAAALVSEGATAFAGNIPAVSSPANAHSNYDIRIFDPDGADLKNFVTMGGNMRSPGEARAGTIFNSHDTLTSPITSITLRTLTDGLTGTISLYGKILARTADPLPFTLLDNGLEHRAKIPLIGGTFTDEGDQGGSWSIDTSREDGPLGDNDNLGYGAVMPGDAPGLFRSVPTWLTGTQNWTLCFWSKCEPGSVFAVMAVGGVNTSYEGLEPRIRSAGGDNTVMVIAGNGGSAVEGNRKSRYFDGLPDTRDGEWHLFTYTGSPMPGAFYIDAHEQTFSHTTGTANTLGIDPTKDWLLNVASWNLPIVYRAFGSIADVRMYSRVLTQGEITKIAAGRG